MVLTLYQSIISCYIIINWYYNFEINK